MHQRLAQARRINQRRMFEEARGGSMDYVNAVDGGVSGLADQFRVIPMGDQRYSGIRRVQADVSLVPGILVIRYAKQGVYQARLPRAEMAEKSDQGDAVDLAEQVRDRLGDVAKPIPGATALHILQRSRGRIEQFFIDVQYGKGIRGIQLFDRGVELPERVFEHSCPSKLTVRFRLKRGRLPLILPWGVPRTDLCAPSFCLQAGFARTARTGQTTAAT